MSSVVRMCCDAVSHGGSKGNPWLSPVVHPKMPRLLMVDWQSVCPGSSVLPTRALDRLASPPAAMADLCARVGMTLTEWNAWPLPGGSPAGRLPLRCLPVRYRPGWDVVESAGSWPGERRPAAGPPAISAGAVQIKWTDAVGV